MGISAKRTLIPAGSRSAFRIDSEHHRTIATLGISIVQEVFNLVKRNLSEGQDARTEKAVRGKGECPCPRLGTQGPRGANGASLLKSNVLCPTIRAPVWTHDLRLVSTTRPVRIASGSKLRARLREGFMSPALFGLGRAGSTVIVDWTSSFWHLLNLGFHTAIYL